MTPAGKRSAGCRPPRISVVQIGYSCPLPGVAVRWVRRAADRDRRAIPPSSRNGQAVLRQTDWCGIWSRQDLV